MSDDDNRPATIADVKRLLREAFTFVSDAIIGTGDYKTAAGVSDAIMPDEPPPMG